MVGVFIAFLLIAGITNSPAEAHRSGCHRWHSCPSDRATYVCGDLGYCAGCPDNQYCRVGKPKRETKDEQSPSKPDGEPRSGPRQKGSER